MALRVAYTTCDLLATSALLKFGLGPDGQALDCLTSLADNWKIEACVCDVGQNQHSLSLEHFTRSLNPMVKQSTTHFKLCQAAWSLSIRLGYAFSRDTSIGDTRISLTEDALMESLFASISNADLQELARVVKDPRMNLTDAIDRTDGYSHLESAVVRTKRDNIGYGQFLIIFRTLLDAGLDISKQSSKGLWPVHELVGVIDGEIDDEDYKIVGDLIREFVRKGTGCTMLTGQGQNVLHLGCSAPFLIRAFLDSETEENVTAALETQDEEGYTPISFALAQAEEKSALLLLQSGKLNPKTLWSPIPLLALCVQMNAQQAFGFLLGAGTETQAIGTNEPALLHEITYRLSAAFLARLMSLPPKAKANLDLDGANALNRAAVHPDFSSFMESYEMANRTSAVLPLLKPYGNTLEFLEDLWPISVATIQQILVSTSSDLWGHSRDSSMVLLDHADTSRLNETNPYDHQRRGLLHYLAGPLKGWHIRQLVKRGADPNLRTGNYDSTPALGYHVGEARFDTAQSLFDNGADPNQTDTYGLDATLSAIWSSHGASPFLHTLMASTTWKIDWQRKCRRTIEIRDKDHEVNGLNALHIAAMRGDYDCIAFYIDNNLLTDLNAATAELFTPMRMAANNESIKSMILLCDHGANINAKAADGKKNAKEVLTVLKDALLRADMETCDELFRQGFSLDSELPGFKSDTSLVWAIKSLKHDVVRWLIARRSGTPHHCTAWWDILN
ncbi:Ankyrin-3 [Cytospora mali]|uniref:Ankyrin-3 n=1 Tax=Cytospora mali TaxID=578113 RepID=A0A194VB81_CYTMA|nr:Ankyrin-3 [Valsa mali var. pyri (nom. inval.)]